MVKTKDITGVAGHQGMSFKIMLYLLVSIAVLFIAIIPARIISGIFSQDTSIFYISFVGFVVLLEFLVWCFLSAPLEIYESRASKKNGIHVPEADTANQTLDSMTEKTPFAEEQKEVDNDPEVTETAWTIQEAEKKDNNPLSFSIDLYKKGCDDFYRSQSTHKKEQLDRIAEYLHYIMAPFIKQEELEAFCAEIMSFAINPNYEPKPWTGLKGTLTSFDVRHLIWNITARLGLGKGKPYSVELCIRFIRTMFPDLCEDLDSSTLKNLRVTSTSDKIHIDEPGKDGISFHIHNSVE